MMGTKFLVGIFWAAIWTSALAALSGLLVVALAYAGMDRQLALGQGQYWFGLGFGLVLGRYVFWREKFDLLEEASK